MCGDRIGVDLGLYRTHKTPPQPGQHGQFEQDSEEQVFDQLLRRHRETHSSSMPIFCCQNPLINQQVDLNGALSFDILCQN